MRIGPHRVGLFFAVVFAAWALPADAQNWAQTSALVTNWTSLACSADGSQVVAAVNGGLIYASTNSGQDWSATSAPTAPWVSLASSADGVTLIAAAGDSPYATTGIYFSTNSGTSWDLAHVSADTSLIWRAVACSANGNVMVAGSSFVIGEAQGSQIFVSTNSGGTWTENTIPFFLNAVACSADGKEVVSAFTLVLNPSGAIYTSRDWGASWAASTAPAIPWYSVASSADGTKLVAAAGPIYVTTNSGNTWLEVNNSNVVGTVVACSADGARLVAAGNSYSPNPIFTSGDAGGTWTLTDAPVTNWTSAASSADGSKLFASVRGGGIYAWQTTPAPVVKTSLSGTNLCLRWTVLSMNFVLQQSPTLIPAEWKTVGVTPILNYTNLQYQVSIPKPDGAMFYRLASQ